MSALTATGLSKKALPLLLALAMGCAAVQRTGWNIPAGREVEFEAARARCAGPGPTALEVDVCLYEAGWQHAGGLNRPPPWAFRSYWLVPDSAQESFSPCLRGFSVGRSAAAAVACLGARGWEPAQGWSQAVADSRDCRWRLRSCRLAAELADSYWASERTPAEFGARRRYCMDLVTHQASGELPSYDGDLFVDCMRIARFSVAARQY